MLSRLDPHRTPNGVRASHLSHSINMELLKELQAQNSKLVHISRFGKVSVGGPSR